MFDEQKQHRSHGQDDRHPHGQESSQQRRRIRDRADFDASVTRVNDDWITGEPGGNSASRWNAAIIGRAVAGYATGRRPTRENVPTPRDINFGARPFFDAPVPQGYVPYQAVRHLAEALLRDISEDHAHALGMASIFQNRTNTRAITTSRTGRQARLSRRAADSTLSGPSNITSPITRCVPIRCSS